MKYLLQCNVCEAASDGSCALFGRYVAGFIILMLAFATSTYANSEGVQMNEIIPAPVEVKKVDKNNIVMYFFIFTFHTFYTTY